MPIEIQRRFRHPVTLADWMRRIAPQGLNTNTQFFLVFLGVLVLHLLAAPVFMESAAIPEPGEPQRYLTSTGAATLMTRDDAGTSEDLEPAGAPAESNPGGAPSDEATPTPSQSLPASASASLPAVSRGQTDESGEAESSPVTPAKPVIPPPALPQLSDLIGEPETAPRAKPVETRAVPSSGGSRHFRTIP